MNGAISVQNRPQRSEILSRVALFESLRANPGILEDLGKVMGDSVYPAGTDIIREGESGSEMYILSSGRAAVYKNTPEGEEFKVVILDGNFAAFFGEGAMIDSDTRSATIRTETECRCLVLKRSDFEELADRHPSSFMPIYKKIAGVIMGRLRKSNQDLLLLYQALVAEIRG